MIKKAFLLFIIIYCVNSYTLVSQETNETPQHFGQFYNNPMLNLSRNGLGSKLEINLDNQRNVGGFSGVSTSYFSFFFNPNYRTKSSPKLNSKNIYGVYFYNDREGDFISRNRVQFTFTRHQRISRDWNFSLGISGGFYLFGIKPTTTGAYSANAFEGNSSLLFYNEKVQIGLSMNQFTNSKIQPVYQITRLKRHYYFYSQYLYKNDLIKFIPSAYIKYENINNHLSYRKDFRFGGSLRFIYYKIIMSGVSYDNGGIYFTTGLNDWEIKKKKISMDFSYFVPMAKQTNINVNRMELNIKLKL